MLGVEVDAPYVLEEVDLVLEVGIRLDFILVYVPVAAALVDQLLCE